MEGSRPGPRKVVIRVRDALLRDTLTSWVDAVPGWVVAGAVSSGRALARLCALRSPDVAVVQLSSADADELAVVSALRDIDPAPHVVGLHGGLDPRKLLLLHRAGAHRLVSTQFGAAALRIALGQVESRGTEPARGGLSERELEILVLISAGCSATDIAGVLEISPHTVTNHTRHIFSKLGVHSRTQAAVEMGRLGLNRGVAGRRRRDAVNGRAGPLRDEVSRILAADRPDKRPPVAVLVLPTEGCWRAGEQRANKIVIVEQNNRNLAAGAVLRGAQAVLSTADIAHLPAAIPLVRAGYLIAPDEVVRMLLRDAQAPPLPRSLTPRERDILGSIALGHSVRETAQSLGIAVKTVQSEQRQLFYKLGAHNRPGALAYARELGLIDT